jgi:hypothetical protein
LRSGARAGAPPRVNPGPAWALCPARDSVRRKYRIGWWEVRAGRDPNHSKVKQHSEHPGGAGRGLCAWNRTCAQGWAISARHAAGKGGGGGGPLSGSSQVGRVGSTRSVAAGGRLMARQLPSAMSSGVSLFTLSAKGLALRRCFSWYGTPGAEKNKCPRSVAVRC